MNKDVWKALVNQSGKGLYKKGYLGREVHEFEIEAALAAQKVFAEMTDTDRIRITGMEFITPPEGATYRSITEPIHRKIADAPTMMDSAWVNVWHSVAEAAYLAASLDARDWEAYPGEIGQVIVEPSVAAYLAFCRECRDWSPSPRMFSELPQTEQKAWQEAAAVAAKMMTNGFGTQR